MDVRCKIEREGGTQVDIDGTDYHFQPREPKGPHLAIVENQKHLARFLSIPEGYELHMPAQATAPQASVAAIAAGTGGLLTEEEQRAEEEAEAARATLAEQGVVLEEGVFGNVPAPVAPVSEGIEATVPDAITSEQPLAAVEPAKPNTVEPVEPEPTSEPAVANDPQEAVLTVKAAEVAGDVSRADLEAAFELLNGRKPNAQAKDETIFDRIKAKLAEDDATTSAAE